MPEIWKDVVGYEGYYQVSNHGKIKSVFRTVNGRVYQEKIRSTRMKNLNTYPKVSLHVGGTDTYYKVHQLVARTFIPNPEDKREVNHIDGNKQNNHVANLEWVTSKENKEHNHKLGITRRGSRHQNSILNEDKVLQIKILLKEGRLKQADIARQFEINQSVIYEVKKGLTWGHVVLPD